MSPHIQISRLFGAATLVIALAACENQTAPTPLNQTPSPSSGGLTVSGVVTEWDGTGGSRPVPNLRLKVRRGASNGGAMGSTPLDDVITDAEGRYTITGLSSPTLVFFQTDPASDYRFLCEAYPVFLPSQGGPPIPRLTELPVVRRSWTGNRPPHPWIIGTSVYGTVTERVNDVPVPVEGASVYLESGLLDPPATTTANGFYMICSLVGTDQERSITASKDGYNATRREYYGGNEIVLNLEMTRR
jgi:hypothetical protein